MSYRQITILGHVGSDPTIRNLPNGSIVANLSIATTEKFTSNGVAKEHTEWWRLDIFQKGERGLVTEVVQKYVHKGSQLMVYGTPTQEEWTDKESGQKRNGFKIRIGHPGTGIQLCGRPNGNGKAVETAANTTQDGTEPSTAPNLADDDIPF